MTGAIDFYFWIGSTYTYLSVNRVQKIAEREGISLRWRPFDVRAIMIEQNNRPFISKPVKCRYMWRDVERRSRRYGIPFKAIPEYPVDPEGIATRIAVVASLEGWCPEYTISVYRSWFLEDRAPGDRPHLRGLISRLGKDADATLARADSSEIRERYDAETDHARRLGIFGSPTFACDSEIFWGDDRFEDAIEWFKSHSSIEPEFR